MLQSLIKSPPDLSSMQLVSCMLYILYRAVTYNSHLVLSAITFALPLERHECELAACRGVGRREQGLIRESYGIID